MEMKKRRSRRERVERTFGDDPAAPVLTRREDGQLELMARDAFARLREVELVIEIAADCTDELRRRTIARLDREAQEFPHRDSQIASDWVELTRDGLQRHRRRFIVREALLQGEGERS